MPRDENGIPSRPVHGIDGEREGGREGGRERERERFLRCVGATLPQTSPLSPRILSSSAVFFSFATPCLLLRAPHAHNRRGFRTERFRAFEGIFNRLSGQYAVKFSLELLFHRGSMRLDLFIPLLPCDFDRNMKFSISNLNLDCVI